MATLIKNQQEKINIDISRIQQILSKILKHLECEDKEVSLLFVDNNDIQKINHEYLGRNNPTNVISFAMNEGEFGDINPYILGDIVISVETALSDAQKEGLSFEDELDFLMIHGILHLLGYNHETSQTEAHIMKEKENEIFYGLKNYLTE